MQCGRNNIRQMIGYLTKVGLRCKLAIIFSNYLSYPLIRFFYVAIIETGYRFIVVTTNRQADNVFMTILKNH